MGQTDRQIDKWLSVKENSKMEQLSGIFYFDARRPKLTLVVSCSCLVLQ